MLKVRVLMVIGAIVLIIILFSLPKVVVDNEEEGMTTRGESSVISPDTTITNQIGDDPVSEELVREIGRIRENLNRGENTKNYTIFADSLSELFRNVEEWDSVAKYEAIIAELDPTESNMIDAGEAYLQAQSFETETGRSEQLGQKARAYFEKVLRKSPENLEVKNKLAMSYVASSNPMQGVSVLREILETDPENKEALFNMGMLSIQSGQFGKAVERFEKLIEVDPENSRAHFYLALSFKESGQLKEAKKHFEIVKKLDSDPEVHANVDSYLKEIN